MKTIKGILRIPCTVTIDDSGNINASFPDVSRFNNLILEVMLDG